MRPDSFVATSISVASNHPLPCTNPVPGPDGLANLFQSDQAIIAATIEIAAAIAILPFNGDGMNTRFVLICRLRMGFDEP
jgi:hypothetical protein